MSKMARPLALLAELTYRCPLRCPYCSNPTSYQNGVAELSTAEWKTVLQSAAELGVLHVGFSGGEPLARTDLEELIGAARASGLYTNLITSAVWLTRDRAQRLKSAGLDSIQVSFQSDKATLSDRIAGASAHDLKLKACACICEAGLPLNLNVVLHRENIDRCSKIIALAERLEADRLELANVQFYGWAFANFGTLCPTLEQVARAEAIATAAAERLAGCMKILFVLPDYYQTRPKPCMNGWGRTHMTVNPSGAVLPCPTATCIPDLRFENVRDRSLAEIWRSSDAFTRFRGTEWLPEPCRSCEFREHDFGGCRCQAALLTGDARNTDPVCERSPQRGKVDALLSATSQAEYIYRRNPT
jgi:pyrroloquinoline quinone biosynthesis protein E